MQIEAQSLDELFIQTEAKISDRVLWFGVEGSWRKSNQEIKQAVQESVRGIYDHGHGIVTGGALGVDFFATEEALILDPMAKFIKIFLPVTLERYAIHYYKRANEGVVTLIQVEKLIEQLGEVRRRNQSALIENTVNVFVDPITYLERNTEIINASDALLGFLVNESEGTSDAINKAVAQGKPVFVRKYSIG
ncbi:hypothetical protein KJ673_04370 [Patescibacteria group bacterium]|nr:hypothetical protein [Patescibacteria group bacterium]MBU4452896.1 hypothetical protein [Patescibacteria group bacterium]MCG2687513.1 hypothetical protein [Candidatus Parcubacteria bacterium]